MSSSGDINMSLRLMTFPNSVRSTSCIGIYSYILMAKMLQELQLSIGTFREYGCAKRFHDLLDSDGLTGELIFCGAGKTISQRVTNLSKRIRTKPARRHPSPPAVSRCI